MKNLLKIILLLVAATFVGAESWSGGTAPGQFSTLTAYKYSGATSLSVKHYDSEVETSIMLTTKQTRQVISALHAAYRWNEAKSPDKTFVSITSKNSNVSVHTLNGSVTLTVTQGQLNRFHCLKDQDSCTETIILLCRASGTAY